MAIPAALMGGQGGPGPGMPGAGGPGGQPGGPDPTAIMGILAALQQGPPQAQEPPIFQEATNAVGLLLQRIQTRSAKAAARVAKALTELQQAKVDLQNEAQKSMQPPPDLGLTAGMGGGMSGMPGG